MLVVESLLSLSLSEDVTPSSDERSLALTVSRFRLESCSRRLSVLVVELSVLPLDDELPWMLEIMRERSSGSAFIIDAFAAERRILYRESPESELSLESLRMLTMSSVMLSAEASVVVLLVEESEDVEVVDDDSRELSRELMELETLLTLDMNGPPSIPIGRRFRRRFFCFRCFVAGGEQAPLSDKSVDSGKRLQAKTPPASHRGDRQEEGPAAMRGRSCRRTPLSARLFDLTESLAVIHSDGVTQPGTSPPLVNKGMNHKEKRILLGLTTTSGSDWREKTDEIREFDLKEIALFPTGIDRRGRDELYRRLEKTSIESIPHVHLRGDMTRDEIEYLKGTYGTRAFNIHPAADGRGYPFVGDSADRDMVFVENTLCVPASAEIDRHGGLCIDFSHWEVAKNLGNTSYSGFDETAKRHPVGCCHVSAFPLGIRSSPSAILSSNLHYLRDLSDLDYVAGYVAYMPDIVSIELENPFSEQIVARDYLERMVNGAGSSRKDR